MDLADRYFAEQCARLGPIQGSPVQRSRKPSASLDMLDVERDELGPAQRGAEAKQDHLSERHDVPLIAAIVWPVAAPSVLGLLVGYFAFILLHLGEHHGWDLSLCRGLTEQHDRHHHARPRGCFGVATSVWDHLFTTR